MENKLVIEIMQCPELNTFSEVCVKKEMSSIQEDLQNVNIKKEKSESICRACLNEGDIPIFGSEYSEDVSSEFSMFAGVSISSDDPYTKFLCKSCNMHLGSAILFRNTARHSDLLLKSTVIVDNIKDDDNYLEIKVDKNELDIKNTQPLKNLLQKSVKVKKTLNKTIGKGRLANNKKNKDLNSLQRNTMGAADFNSEDKNVSKNGIKGNKKNMPNCRKCNLSFNSIDDLNEHKQTEEHANKFTKEECPICHKMYASVYIKTHMSVHGTETSTCDICGKSFRLQLTLSNHRATHFYELPYKCTVCPYKGRFSQSLRLHMRKHTGEKPYQCSECPAAFITKSNLVAHEKRNHKTREFPCELCEKAFCTKRDLEIHHKATHLGMKEHNCDICGKDFGSRAQMMKHTRKVHKRAKLTYGRQPLYLKLESMKKQEGNIPEETKVVTLSDSQL